MGFEKYNHKNLGRFKSKDPQLTIGIGRLATLNRAAVEVYNVRKYKTLDLYFDKEKCLIGIELKEDNSGAFNISHHKNNKNCNITITSFVMDMRIKYPQYGIKLYIENDFIVGKVELRSKK